MNIMTNEIKNFILENEAHDSTFTLFYNETSDHFSIAATIDHVFTIKDSLIFQNNNLSCTFRLFDTDKIKMINNGFEILTDSNYIKLELQ